MRKPHRLECDITLWGQVEAVAVVDIENSHAVRRPRISEYDARARDLTSPPDEVAVDLLAVLLTKPTDSRVQVDVLPVLDELDHAAIVEQVLETIASW